MSKVPKFVFDMDICSPRYINQLKCFNNALKFILKLSIRYYSILIDVLVSLFAALIMMVFIVLAFLLPTYT